MRLPGPLIASVSAVPLNVAVSPTMPVSPSNASRPVLRGDRAARGREEGRDVGGERVRGVDRAEAVVDADPVDVLRRVLVGDDERPAREAVVAPAGLDVGHGVGGVARGRQQARDVGEGAVARGLPGGGQHVGGRRGDRLVAARADLEAHRAAVGGVGRGRAAGAGRRVGAPVEAGPRDRRAGGQRERGGGGVDRGRVAVDVDVAHVVVVVQRARGPDPVAGVGAAGGGGGAGQQLVADGVDAAAQRLRVADRERGVDRERGCGYAERPCEQGNEEDGSE